MTMRPSCSPGARSSSQPCVLLAIPSPTGTHPGDTHPASKYKATGTPLPLGRFSFSPSPPSHTTKGSQILAGTVSGYQRDSFARTPSIVFVRFLFPLCFASALPRSFRRSLQVNGQKGSKQRFGPDLSLFSAAFFAIPRAPNPPPSLRTAPTQLPPTTHRRRPPCSSARSGPATPAPPSGRLPRRRWIRNTAWTSRRG